MFGWHELSRYQPAIALLGGAVAVLFFCLLGRALLGRALPGRDRDQAASAWRTPLEFLAGVLATGLGVQALALAGIATRPVVLATTLVAALAAAVALHRGGAALPRPPAWTLTRIEWLAWVPTLWLAAALLMSGMAPQSRADETGYHALVIARVLEHGRLDVPVLPWEATVAPQFIWHHAMVPVFAAAGSAAAGVVAACAAILLALALAQAVGRATGSRLLAAAAGPLVLAGGYAASLFPALGPHAFGALATFVACERVLARDGEPGPGQSTTRALEVGVACAAMVTAKVTMLPLAALLLACVATPALRAPLDARSRAAIFAALSLPLLAMAPGAAAAWVASGSPFGAIGARLLHAAAFDEQALQAYEGTRAQFAGGLTLRFEAAYWSLPLVLLAGAGLALRHPVWPRPLLWAIAGVQALLLVLVLPPELRHLGGVQYVLAAAGLGALGHRLRGQRPTMGLTAAMLLAVLPWFGLSHWIGTIPVPLLAGRISPGEFLGRYSGLFEDYVRLDRLLPRDAVLLMGRSRTEPTQYAWLARPPTFYAPRRVLFHTGEVEPGMRAYLLYVGACTPGSLGRIPLDPWLPAGTIIGRRVYRNDSASFYPSRTPRRELGGRSRVEVFELLPSGGSADPGRIESTHAGCDQDPQ